MFISPLTQNWWTRKFIFAARQLKTCGTTSLSGMDSGHDSKSNSAAMLLFSLSILLHKQILTDRFCKWHYLVLCFLQSKSLLLTKHFTLFKINFTGAMFIYIWISSQLFFGGVHIQVKINMSTLSNNTKEDKRAEP